MMVTGRRAAAAERIAATDPAGLLYGAIVSASVLATVSAHSEQFEYVVLASVGALTVYWLAHVYIAAQTRQLGGDNRHALRRIVAVAGHESSVLRGGVPAIAVYAGGALVGLDAGSAASAAVYFSVLLLMGVGYLAAHRAGRTGRAAVVDVAVAGLFGLVVVAAKALQH